MESYVEFAMFYDMLTTDVNYKKRAEYILKLFEMYDRKPALMLDLACGTGSFSCEFSEKDIQVIGVDASYEMLSAARVKSEQRNKDILFLHQRAQDLELYGTVDGAVCCLDSLNHITNFFELEKSFKKISLFLEKDRLFIFDVNTLYKHSTVLGNNTFVKEIGNVFCIWQNAYDNRKKLTEINIDFFAADECGTYSRFNENFFERAYTGEEIAKALQCAGLKPEAIYEEMTFASPKNDSQRVMYITRKV